MFENIPVEMRAYRQFVCWKLEESTNGKPTKVPYSPLTHNHANVNTPDTWCHYDQAVAALATGWYSGIGFVLTENDPYAFIDLDEPKNPDGSALTQSEFDTAFARQKRIFDEFDSYAELSPSGKGLHIIVKGAIPNGRKRSSVEVYSSQRYMTMTGQVYRNGGIKEHNDLLNSLWSEMGKGKDASLFYAGLEQAKLTDAEVLDMANTAANAEKFRDLFYEGNWQKHEYPSQSEADFALIDIIAFYSQNRAQTQKIFLTSKLATREKSRAQYRINYMLNRCFDKMLPPVDFEGLRNQVNEAIEKRKREEMAKEQIQQKISASAPLEIDEGKAYLNLDLPAELPDKINSVYTPPKGLVGQIAQFIYAQAPLPVPEIALAAAIGLMSGIVGKAYNVSATGLNQYTLLLAATGTGKESAAQGIAKLMSAVKKLVPSANDFIGPSEISSPQALVKYLGNKSSSVVSLVGEFGLHLRQMGAENASPHMAGLKRAMLDLFNKSGEGNMLQPTIYSDREKNTEVLNAPAFSLLGESAPERFYEALTESMITEGLLPRFTVIEYYGDRVDRNPGAALVKPSEELIQAVATLCANALQLNHQKKVIHVQYNPGAKSILDNFDKTCTQNIRGSMELRRQLWNRAHIKALKLAATVAVGVNPFDPVIDEETADWAIGVIVADVKNMLTRFESGDVGVNNEETKQLQLLVKLVKRFVTTPWPELAKVAGDKMQPLHAEKIIPYSYLQRNTSTAPAFKKDRLGATNALKRALKTLEERGDIQPMGRADLVKRFGTGAASYCIANAGAFGL